tara:strand:- start:152 stop:568 length:417 start_codon:yes stop_codon:yes gene_type:complete
MSKEETKSPSTDTNMVEYSCSEAYKEIMARLGTSEGSKIPEEFEKGLSNLNNATADLVCHMGMLDVKNIKLDILKQVIGRYGCYFIRTTQESDLDFIWHNRSTNQIEFWGPRNNIPYAKDVIRDRISRITASHNLVVD